LFLVALLALLLIGGGHAEAWIAFVLLAIALVFELGFASPSRENALRLFANVPPSARAPPIL
jgi:hypothetical protein